MSAAVRRKAARAAQRELLLRALPPVPEADSAWDSRVVLVVQVALDGGGRLDDAARCWARAVAARDGLGDAAPLEVARPVIGSVLSRADGSMLVVALDHDALVGFAACEPRIDLPRPTFEVRYLAVDPSVWGLGVAGQLLRGMRSLLARRGTRHALLAVYADNPAAIRAYERDGWRPTGEVRSHARTGRVERMYETDIVAG